MTPHRIILLSYLVVIAIGTFLLYLPISTHRGISFIDALFTATSAISVTGHVVVDIASTFTSFGKLVILLLIQIGGLGYMGITTYFLVLLRKKLSLRDRILLAESVNYPGMHGLVRFLKRIVPFVIGIELFCTLLLFPLFLKHFDLPTSLAMSVFHSVSAFNNAGFNILPEGLSPFMGSLWLNLVFSLLIILGGLGFYVIHELILYHKKEIQRLSTHTKLVLTSTLFLLVAGFLILLIDTIRWDGYGLKEKLLIAFFHSVSSRTAGFSTVDLKEFSEGALFFLVVFMFVGTGPGGTGGGIKITTAVVIILVVHSYLRSSGQMTVFGRRIPEDTIQRAITIFVLSFTYTTLATLFLTHIEKTPLLPTLFEVVSAFSSVGLSLGNPQGLSYCADWSSVGKSVVIITMLMGRMGIMSFMLALYGRGEQSRIKPPEARLLL